MSFNSIDAITIVLMLELFLPTLPRITTAETKVNAANKIKLRKIAACVRSDFCNTGYTPSKNKPRQNKKYFL